MGVLSHNERIGAGHQEDVDDFGMDTVGGLFRSGVEVGVGVEISTGGQEDTNNFGVTIDVISGNKIVPVGHTLSTGEMRKDKHLEPSAARHLALLTDLGRGTISTKDPGKHAGIQNRQAFATPPTDRTS